MIGSETNLTPAASEADTLCRDCGTLFASTDRPETQASYIKCGECASPRLATHAEIATLGIAHLDCDAFFAAVEKRDDPDLRDKPVIIGGGKRGVVSTCCYVARKYGVHSAMPMFKANKLCPQAVVIKPNMEKYSHAGQAVRKLMRELTPLVEPLSIDEAFMDLRGTQKLHHALPAQVLARLANRIESECGISVSIGLSHNKFLAKLASDMDKPRGLFIIGVAETERFLSTLPVRKIWGIGKAMQKKLAERGITHVHHLQNMDERDLMQHYGQLGLRLSQLSRGIDRREVIPTSETKSVSSETTFENDLSEQAELEKQLWKLCERTAARCKDKDLAGRVVVLKLKNNKFQSITRNHTLNDPTQMADVMFVIGREMLAREIKQKPAYYRLIGIGVSNLTAGDTADPIDLADPEKQKRKAIEQAVDSLREKYGHATIGKGRGFK